MVGLNDDALRKYVERIDFERDAVFGVYDDALRLVGAAHLRARNWGVRALFMHCLTENARSNKEERG